MSKKSICLFLSIVFVLCNCLSVFAADTEKKRPDTWSNDGDWWYEVLEDGTTVVREYDSENMQVKVPATMGGHNVDSIGKSVFSKSLIQSVEFEGTLTEIDSSAFSDCGQLTNVTLPETLITIGSNAFANCGQLDEIIIPASVTTANKVFTGNTLVNITFEDGMEKIPQGICSGALDLTNIEIPTTVKEIGSNAFNGCTSLTSVKIPDSVTTIDSSAFENCESLNHVEMSKNLVTLSKQAFGNCTALKSISLPKTIATGNTAFKGSGLETFLLPEGVTTVPEGICVGCTMLTTITLPESTLTIEDNAFEGCTSLTTVHLPYYVLTMGKEVFKDCTSLSSITFSPFLREMGSKVFGGTKVLKEVVIPKALTTAKDAFNSSSVESAKIETGLLIIPDSLFKDANKLSNIEIPSTVVTIGKSAFEGCTALTHIELSDSIANIGSSAFKESNLSSVVIPRKVTKIDSNTFESCSSMGTVTLEGPITSVGSSAFKGCSSLGTIDIPESCTKIDSSAFENAGISSIELHEGLTSIGSNAFKGASELDNVDIPDSVSSLGSSVFESCTNLTNIHFGVGVESIPQNAFKTCLKLESIVLPRFCESIGAGAFMEDVKLSSVTIFPATTKIGKFKVGDNLTAATDVFPYIDSNFRIYGVVNSFANSYASESLNTTFQAINKPCTKLSIDIDNIKIKGTNKKVMLPVTIEAEDSTSTITFKSSDEKVATVENGLIQSKKAGTTVITMSSDNGLSDKVTVTVKALPDSITIDKSEFKTENGEKYLELVEGDTSKLTPILTSKKGEDVEDDLIWQSRDDSVLTVDSEGNIEAVGIGTTTVTVTSANNSKLTDVCIIRVRGLVTMTTKVEEGGTIITVDGDGVSHPLGDTEVWSDDTPIFKIIPDYGYVVKDVLVDGKSQGPVTSYSYYRPSQDSVITATFAPVEVSLRKGSNGHSTITITSTAQLKDLKLCWPKYDEEGRLTDITIDNIKTEAGNSYSKTFDSDFLDGTNKLFLWEAFDTLRPIWSLADEDLENLE